MIKFFRKIRQNLLSEGRTGKYLKYAFGEIILVVIGILIALQVNDWNQERKNRIIENKLYHSLISSLESDLEDVNEKINIVGSSLDAQDILMEYSFDKLEREFDIQQIEQLVSDLQKCARSFFPNYGFYNKITSNQQIDLIKSDQLQLKIIELYEQYYQRYSDVDQSLEKQAVFSLNTNYFSKIRHLYHDGNWNGLTMDMIKEHYPILQEETRKINWLTSSSHFTMRNCKTQIELLIEDIKVEVKR